MEQLTEDYNRFQPQIVYVHTGTVETQPEKSLPERMCMFYEIELITDSVCGGVWTADQFLPAQRGTLYIRQPGVMVRGAGRYSFSAIIFDALYDPDREPLYQMGVHCLHSEMDLPYLHSLRSGGHFMSFLDRLPPEIRVRNVERYLPFFENAYHHAIDHRPAFQLLVRKELLSILSLVLQELEEAPEPQNSGVLCSLQRVKKYMDEHYREHLNLEQLSACACMSKEYLCRQFQRYFRYSPMEYLRSVRMQHARYLLISTDQTIAEIVEACGFSSAQYFYHQFQKTEGCSPASFRRKQIWG